MAATAGQAATLQEERLTDAAFDLASKTQETVKTSSPNAKSFGLGELLILLFFAAANDLLDFVELTGLGYILVVIVDILTAGAITLWGVLKFHRFPKKRAAVQFFAELLPVVGLLPGWTLWVLYIYAKQHTFLLAAVQKAASVATSEFQKHTQPSV